MGTMVDRGSVGIRKTPGVCGGDARVRNTRIAVWLLVQWRRLGLDDHALLRDYPTLTPEDLVNAWTYADAHQAEIEKAISENEREDDPS